jgi:hypothetical protein
MTAIAGFFSRVQAWLASRLGGSPPTAQPIPEQPLLRLQRILVGIATSPGGRGQGFQLMIESLSSEQLTCKSRELLVEGDEYELQLLLTGVGPVRFRVQVDWVLLSSYGHSAGLRIEAEPEVSQALQQFLELQRAGLRGK